MNKSIILTHNEISLKIDRIAWQIIEQHYGEESLLIVGLEDRGAEVAKKIKIKLETWSSATILYTTISVDKTNPLSSPILLKNESLVHNQPIILVDDVLNSGATLCAALKEVLNHSPKSVKTAVLANRDHHKFPIQANFVGISLATTVKEHITYEEVNGQMSISLN